MRFLHAISLGLLLTGFACQPQASASTTVTIVDGEQVHVLTPKSDTLRGVLAEAGVALYPADVVLFNGQPLPADLQLPGSRGTLQIRRAVNVTLSGKERAASAATLGEAIAESGISLRLSDRVSPPVWAALTAPVTVEYTAVRELFIHADGQDHRILSSATTVGEALAGSGLPLLGLDYSQPAEGEPLPAVGQIRLVRVSETVILTEKPIAFKTEYQDSPNVEVGQEQIVQPGVQGLSVSRVRIRYEDGVEVSRQTEAETVVRPPQNRLALRGTQIAIKTVTVGGTQIQYWLELQMYATVYSPCTSGTGKCSYGTASGLRAGKGVVAVDPGLYAQLQGQRLYIPGYGSAVIGDLGGGYIVEQNVGVSRYRWIDLGFDDNNITDMTGWVTVYFLAPPPAAIPEVLK